MLHWELLTNDGSSSNIWILPPLHAPLWGIERHSMWPTIPPWPHYSSRSMGRLPDSPWRSPRSWRFYSKSCPFLKAHLRHIYQTFCLITQPPQPILAIQHALPRSQIPTGITLFTFSQVFGGAVMVVLSQTVFINSLRTTIPQYAPSVNAAMVIAAGGTRFRQLLPKEALAGALLAYGKSLGRIYYLTAPTAVVSLFFSSFMEWKDLRKRERVQKLSPESFCYA